MSDKEFETVMKLSGPTRYEYFVERAAQAEELWTLRDVDGFPVLADDKGKKYVPVWPHSRFAGAFAVGEWGSLRPESIALKDWLEVWTPGIVRDSVSVAVFPTPMGQGVALPLQSLKDDLEDEVSLYEW